MNGAGRASIAFYVFDTAELYEGASPSQRRRCCGKAAIETMIDFRALRCSCDWHFLMSCRLHFLPPSRCLISMKKVMGGAV